MATTRHALSNREGHHCVGMDIGDESFRCQTCGSTLDVDVAKSSQRATCCGNEIIEDWVSE
jgi:hypothetical protein